MFFVFSYHLLAHVSNFVPNLFPTKSFKSSASICLNNSENSLPLFYRRRWFICSVYVCVCVQWGIWCRKDGEHKKSDSVFGTCGVLTQVWHSGTAQRHRPTGEDGGLAEDFRERKSSFCILLF